MASLKVAGIFWFIGTLVAPFRGFVETTVGIVPGARGSSFLLRYRIRLRNLPSETPASRSLVALPYASVPPLQSLNE
jgi:hypothetical protein